MEYDEIKDLPVMDSVIRETLRMHPPIHSIARMVREDIPVPATLAAPSEDIKYVVPKGDIVLASPMVSQLDPSVWDDSARWEPLRWYDEKGVAALANKQYNEGRVRARVQGHGVALSAVRRGQAPVHRRAVCVPADQHCHLRALPPVGVPPEGRVPEVRLLGEP